MLCNWKLYSLLQSAVLSYVNSVCNLIMYSSMIRFNITPPLFSDYPHQSLLRESAKSCYVYFKIIVDHRVLPRVRSRLPFPKLPCLENLIPFSDFQRSVVYSGDFQILPAVFVERKFMTLKVQEPRQLSLYSEWKSKESFYSLAKVRDLTLFESIQTDSGADPFFFSKNTGRYFPGCKRPIHKADSISVPSGEVTIMRESVGLLAVSSYTMALYEEQVVIYLPLSSTYFVRMFEQISK